MLICAEVFYKLGKKKCLKEFVVVSVKDFFNSFDTVTNELNPDFSSDFYISNIKFRKLSVLQ